MIVLLLLQNLKRVSNIEPKENMSAGIAEAISTRPPALQRSGPAGRQATTRMYLEQQKEKKNRKIKQGLYGYGPMNLMSRLKRELVIKRFSSIPYI